MSEPRRLLDDPAVPEELRQDLGRASEHSADYDVSAGAARFEQFLASPQAAVPDATTATAAATSKAGTAVVVGLVAAGGAGLLAWAISRPSEPPPKPELAPVMVVEQESSPTPPTPPPVLPAAEVLEEPPPPALPEPVLVPEPPTKRPKPSLPTKAAPEGPDQLKAEMTATQAAKRALAGNPARALELARDAEREFKGGYFSEDRKAIIVLALFGLDREDEAMKKAKSFLGSHSRSSFADRIRAEVEKHAK